MMEWLLGTSKDRRTPEQIVKDETQERRKEIYKAKRALERQDRALDRQYAKAIANAKSYAKSGKTRSCVSAEVMSAVTYRKQQERCLHVKSMLTRAETRLSNINTMAVLKSTVDGLVRIMILANRITGGAGEMKQMFMVHERENERMQLQEEMVDELFQEMQESEDGQIGEFDSEVDEVLQGVFDDVGLELAETLRESIQVPTSPIDRQLKEQDALLTRLFSTHLPRTAVGGGDEDG